MNEILTEIKEVLKRSPARFSKIYFRADVAEISASTIKVEITSTLDFFGDYVVPAFPNPLGADLETAERLMEKWHAAGIAVGAVEYYLTDKKFNYVTIISVDENNEINARILINV
jgi:hypothetical protein